jgi:WD40 repeat protein
VALEAEEEEEERLRGHHNRMHPLGAAISPCMRYVATDSEDNSCYIYDVRQGRPVERIWGSHRDTVADVAFLPPDRGADRDGLLRRPPPLLQGRTVSSWSPTSKRLVSGSRTCVLPQGGARQNRN